ncbi:MAG: serine O-acetyltransferase [Puniceicoccales bacterium]
MSVKTTSDPIWEKIRQDAIEIIESEPVLACQIQEIILDRSTLEEVLSYRLAEKLTFLSHWEFHLEEVFLDAMTSDPQIGRAIRNDIQAIYERDPACLNHITPVLYYKGFKAIVCHRISHWLWNQGRKQLALHLQSLKSEFFGVDIHPAAVIGSGILLDHATGFVAGETSRIADDVSILHAVTLGGTGKESGDRHPKIERGVLIGAGAKILGNITIGACSRIGANSVVLESVPPNVTVVGVPSRIVGTSTGDDPAHKMDHDVRCGSERQSSELPSSSAQS